MRAHISAYIEKVGAWDGAKFRRESSVDSPKKKIEDPKHVSGFRLIRCAWILQWLAIGRALSWRDLDQMLVEDEGRFALLRAKTTKFVGVDVDQHDGPSKRWIREQKDAWDADVFAGRLPPGTDTMLRMSMKPKVLKAWVRERVVGWRREVLGPTVKKVVEAARAEGFDPFVERTPRGFHVTIFLTESVPVLEARMVGLAWVRRAGVTRVRDVGVEVFPKVNGDGLGETFALPLSARQRLVEAPNDDGVVWGIPKHTTRDRDMDELLATRPASLEALREGFAVLSRIGPEEAKSEAEREADREARRALECLVGGSAYEVLRGADFVISVLDRLERGLDRGVSYDQFRPVVASCAYAGMSLAEMLEAMGNWLRQGKHRARHCETESGIRQLLAVARCCYRHFERGLGETTYWNGMDAPELRSVLAELAGIKPRVVQKRARFGMLAAA